MYTKSKIQMIRESIEIANDYKDSLISLMDKYNIEDGIFIYKNHQTFEVTRGYFVENNEYNNIKDAIIACSGDFEHNGIRIINNQRFIVGNIKMMLSECSKDTKIFDIHQLNFIE